MATTLEQLRFLVEQDIRPNALENDWVVGKANEAQSDFGVNINIPDTDTIAITTTAILYPLPADLKIINRLWLSSDRDNDLDREFKWPYRIYSGNIIFHQPYLTAETLNVDYYRNMTVYADVEENLDLPDRFVPLYTSYLKMEWYDLPSVKTAMGDAQALREWNKHNARYQNMKGQVIATYSLQNEPAVVQERW